MKHTLLALLGCVALAMPAVAAPKHTFTSADGKKSFQATLKDFDPSTEAVTVRVTGGREMTFKLDVLDEKSQEYVKEMGPVVAAARAIRVDFDLWKGEPDTKRSDIERTVSTPAGYEIELRNWTKKDVRNVEVRYTIFHRKDAENGPGSIAQSKGSFHISNLFAQSDDMNRTEPITLVRYSRQKSGGG